MINRIRKNTHFLALRNLGAFAEAQAISCS